MQAGLLSRMRIIVLHRCGRADLVPSPAVPTLVCRTHA